MNMRSIRVVYSNLTQSALIYSVVSVSYSSHQPQFLNSSLNSLHFWAHTSELQQRRAAATELQQRRAADTERTLTPRESLKNQVADNLARV